MNRRTFITATLTMCTSGFIRLSRASQARVVIIGGGFGGLSAARALRRLAPELAITLVERNPHYLSCPGSNQVIASLQDERSLVHDYPSVAKDRAIEWITATVSRIDTRHRKIHLGDHLSLPYDRLIIAAGVDFRWDAIEGYGEAASQLIPHAWKSGPQTLLLRNQLQSMRPGGTVIMTVPENPYRCPPGPYERASLMARYLSRNNPRAKILILDAKTQFSKQRLFTQAWQELYPGMIEWVSSEKDGILDHIDAGNRTVHTEFGRFRADVLNVIPPQQAAELTRHNGLSDTSGWCPVDPISFESTLSPGIHIIGDACNAFPMPKSAFSAHAQAGVCAAAIVRMLANSEPLPPKLINHCYSFVDSDQAISVTGVYGYQRARKVLDTLSMGETPPSADRRLEARLAEDWYSLFIRETFG